MTDLRQAAQQALEALENTSPLGFNMESDKKFFAAITALRAALTEDALQRLTDVHQEIEAALEQPEQEPVAWQYKKEGGGIFVSDQCPADVEVWNDIEWSKPLYTHPPRREWRGLTEEEIVAIFLLAPTQPAFARAIEAALKERNA